MHIYSQVSTVKVPLNNVQCVTTQMLGSSQVYNESKTLHQMHDTFSGLFCHLTISVIKKLDVILPFVCPVASCYCD